MARLVAAIDILRCHAAPVPPLLFSALCPSFVDQHFTPSLVGFNYKPTAMASRLLRISSSAIVRYLFRSVFSLFFPLLRLSSCVLHTTRPALFAFQENQKRRVDNEFFRAAFFMSMLYTFASLSRFFPYFCHVCTCAHSFIHVHSILLRVGQPSGWFYFF